MGDNIFAIVYDAPFTRSEEWFPFLADNTNSAPGDDVPSLSVRRQVSVAALVVAVHRRSAPRAHRIETPIARDAFDPAGRATLAPKARDWFLSDPV